MNTSHWAWRFVGWFVAVLVGAGSTVWVYKKQSHKAVSYRVVSISPLGPLQARGFSDLKLSKGDKTIERPFLITISLTNSGDVNIVPSDFATPLTIKPIASPWPIDKSKNDKKDAVPSIEGSIYKIPFKGLLGYIGGAQVVDARIASTSPSQIPVELVITPENLQVRPLLLNVGDEITVEMLISGDVSAIEVGARIAGVKRVTEDASVDAAAAEAKATWYLIAAFSSMVIGFIAIVFSVILSNPTYKTMFNVMSNVFSIAFGVLIFQTLAVARIQSVPFVLAVTLVVTLLFITVTFYIGLKGKQT